jgi:hypothetical protein
MHMYSLLTSLTLCHRRTQRLPPPHRPRLATSPSRNPTTSRYSTRRPLTPGSAHPTHSSFFYLCCFCAAYLPSDVDNDVHPAPPDWLRGLGYMTSSSPIAVGQKSLAPFFCGFSSLGAVRETCWRVKAPTVLVRSSMSVDSVALFRSDAARTS